VGELTLPGR